MAVVFQISPTPPERLSLTRLARHRTRIKFQPMVLMFQAEVANRLYAKSSDQNLGEASPFGSKTNGM